MSFHSGLVPSSFHAINGFMSSSFCCSSQSFFVSQLSSFTTAVLLQWLPNSLFSALVPDILVVDVYRQTSSPVVELILHNSCVGLHLGFVKSPRHHHAMTLLKL
ncbi:hypothetical protein NQ317_017044 [Molorchus minor]|uniref:Uncharacterized protein n=1 Tax=Molorchus minor TaxID=1323400 RepID=A0ABQ9K7B9_9CUCU|nr:hypothetical protein NQ317_017044 [Molorchus minor]